MKVERVSYDVMTPSAARGVLEAIYWKPEIRWVVDRIHVLKPIRFTNVRRNELSCKIPLKSAAAVMKGDQDLVGIYIDEIGSDGKPKWRQQRAATVLRDVEYVVEAHFDVQGGSDPPVKHFEMFKRRAEKGQCFHRPYLGCREFDCQFAWLEGDTPRGFYADEAEKDLGFMLHDIDFENDMTPRFFHAVMRQGVIDVPSFDSAEAPK